MNVLGGHDARLMARLEKHGPIHIVALLAINARPSLSSGLQKLGFTRPAIYAIARETIQRRAEIVDFLLARGTRLPAHIFILSRTH